MFRRPEATNTNSLPDTDPALSLPRDPLSKLIHKHIPKAHEALFRTIDSDLEERVLTQVGNRFGNHVPLHGLVEQDKEGGYVWSEGANTEMQTAVHASQFEIGRRLRVIGIQPGSSAASAVESYFDTRYQEPDLVGAQWRTGTLRTMKTFVDSSLPLQEKQVISVMAAPLPAKDTQALLTEWLTITNGAVARNLPEEVIERYASLYGHLGAIKESPQEAAAIREHKLFQLTRLQEYVETHPGRGLTPDQVELIGRLAWEDRPSLRKVREDLRRGNQLTFENPLAGYDTHDLVRLSGAAALGVTFIGTSLGAGVPAVAQVAITPSNPANLSVLTEVITPSASLVRQNIVNVPGTSKNITVVTTGETLTKAPQAMLVENAAESAASTLGVVTDRQDLVPNTEKQSTHVEDSIRRDLLNDPEADADAIRLEIVRQLGASAPELNENNPEKPQAKGKSLGASNRELATLLTEKIEDYESRINANGITDDSTRLRTQYSIVLLRSLIEDPSSSNSLSAEEKKDILTAKGTEFGPIIDARAAEIAESLGTEELGKWNGLDEEARRILTHAYATVELATLPKSAIEDMMQAKALENIDEERPGDVTHGTENKPKTRDNDSESKPGGTSLERANKDQLVNLVEKAAEKYNWSTQQKLFYKAAVLEGYPLRLAAGAGGNSKVEADGYNANIEEYVNRIGFGLFQWSFERRVALEAAAETAGVNLKVNNLENYRFQLRFAKKEMKKRTLRDGGNTTEWELFTSLKDVGEIAWKFQDNFERPLHEDRQSNRTKAAEKAWKQLNKTWKVIIKPKASAQPKAPEQQRGTGEANVGKYNLWSGLPEGDKKRIIDRIENTKRDGAQLLESATPYKIGEMKKKGYENGELPDDILITVDNKGHKLEPDAGKAFKAMAAQYKTDTGDEFEIGGPKSAYRDLAGQRKVIGEVEPGFAAKVGESNHGLAFAVDMGPVMGGAVGGFNSKGAKWFKQNGPRFGYFWSYSHRPGGNKPEPHHIEYHG